MATAGQHKGNTTGREVNTDLPRQKMALARDATRSGDALAPEDLFDYVLSSMQKSESSSSGPG